MSARSFLSMVTIVALMMTRAGGGVAAPHEAGPPQSNQVPSAADVAKLGVPCLTGSGITLANARVGDLYTPKGFDAGVEIPSPGGIIWDVLDRAGGPEVVGAHTDASGRIFVYAERQGKKAVGLRRCGSETSSGGQVRPNIAACSDNSFAREPFEWPANINYNWWFGAATVPSELILSNARDAATNAARHIVQDYNDCGLPDNMHAKGQANKGDTTTGADINAIGTCTTGDGVNVFEWNHDVPSPAIATTCMSYAPGVGGSLSADVILDTPSDGTHWTANPGPGCSNKYDVEAVATHERGHVFGLDHVAGASHTELTMYPGDTPFSCSTALRTLALGDVSGLNAQYP